MGHKWIIDVLSDMETFAAANGLPKLAEHLCDASLVAAAEISSLEHALSRDGSNDVIDYNSRVVGALRLA